MRIYRRRRPKRTLLSLIVDALTSHRSPAGLPRDRHGNRTRPPRRFDLPGNSGREGDDRPVWAKPNTDRIDGL